MAGRAAVAAVCLVVSAMTGGAALAQAPLLHCIEPQKSWVVADLLFGRSHVSAQRWSRFLAQEVTPRFPDGLTVIDARGQWRAPGSRRIVKERSTVVTIAMPPGAGNDGRLRQIVEAYKARFKQQSVGLIVRPACVSF